MSCWLVINSKNHSSNFQNHFLFSPVELISILSPDSRSVALYISWWVPHGPCGRPWWSRLEKRKCITAVLRHLLSLTASQCLESVWVWGNDVITFCNDYLPIIEEQNIFSFSFSGIEVNLQFSAITSVGFLDMGLSGRTCTKRKWTDNVREKQGTMQQYIHSFM